MSENAKILVYDVTVLEEDLKKLRPAMQLLTVFTQTCDVHNKIELKKSELAKIFKVSNHTISNWLRNLVKANAIKYKYSGSARLNPFFYFYGTQEDFDVAEREYKAFKSDIKF